MKKQPAGTYRKARGKERPPATYCIRLRADEPSGQDVLLGISQRLPKGKWRMWPADLLGDDPDVFMVSPAEAQVKGTAEFADHTAGVDWLVGVRQGLAKVSENGSAAEAESVQETAAIQADPETMAAIAEAQAEVDDGVPEVTFRSPEEDADPSGLWDYPAPEGAAHPVTGGDTEDMS